MKTITITFLFLFFSTGILYAQISRNDIIFSTKGLSQKSSSEFKSQIDVFVNTLNQLNTTPSIAPINLEVIYKNGKLIFKVVINFNYTEVFSDNSDYSSLNRQYGVFGRGTSLWLQNQIFSALAEYNASVALKYTSLTFDIQNFFCEVELKKSNGDWVRFFASNFVDERGLYHISIFRNVAVRMGGIMYKTAALNPETLNRNYFFYVGNSKGLDGKKTGAYYFSKFFKIAEQ